MKPLPILRCLVFCCIIASCAEVATAGKPPWLQLVTFRRVNADPNKDYPLSEGNGPWMILAATFSGDGAATQARQLVYEFRKQYRLPAYTHQMTFDFTKRLEGRGLGRDGGPKRMRYERERRVDEIAVLVGDYPSIDDPQTQRALQRVKQMTPNTLVLQDGRPSYQQLVAWRTMWGMVGKTLDGRIVKEQRRNGPLAHAFVTTNPLLPREYFVPRGVDPFLAKMNEGVEFSLLDCAGTYSVKVATFSAQYEVDPQRIKAIESGKPMRSRLAEAADRAHLLTLELRKKGYPAFEFHDRYASLVTIGSFDTIGMPRQDGRIEINPAIFELMRKFGVDRDPLTGKVGQPRTLTVSNGEKIPFDVQPFAVEVPRPAISSQYARRWLLRR